MLRLAFAGGFAALLCLNASHATQIRFPNQPGLGARASVEIQRPVAQNPRGSFAPVQVHLAVGGLEINQGTDGFHTVKVEGLSPLGQWGLPDIAGTGVLIAVPPGTEPELTILSKQEQLLQQALVQPCQPKTRCNRPQEAAFHFNSKVYDSDSSYPAVSARIEEIGSFQGLRLVRLALYPLQMKMKEKSLLVTTEMIAEVRFKGKSRDRISLPVSLQRAARELTANGDDIASFTSLNTSPETMIVIVADRFKATISPLVEWKRQRGLNVQVTTFAEAGGSRDKVKQLLQNIYNSTTTKPTYLLLVGNKTTLPGFREKTGYGPAATDYSYSLLEGRDTIPDILYGRLIADNEAEVKTQVDRWVAYEKTATGQWLSKAITIASKEGENPSDEGYAMQVGKALQGGRYTTINPLFERNSTASTANISAALKDGHGWISYFGHGTGTQWSFNKSNFTVRDIDRIENEGKLPFIVDVACNNASWADLDRCFGKAWISLERNGSPNGAVAYYGGSVEISWTEPAVMSVGIAKYHFEKPVHSVGASVLAGQLYMYEQLGITNNTTDNLKWYNLFADPSLLLRTDVPKTYAVADQVLTGNGDAEVQIRVSDAFGGGFAGVQASVYTPGDTGPLAVNLTDASGLVTLTLKGYKAVPPGALLTTSGYNLETYQVPLVP